MVEPSHVMRLRVFVATLPVHVARFVVMLTCLLELPFQDTETVPYVQQPTSLHNQRNTHTVSNHEVSRAPALQTITDCPQTMPEATDFLASGITDILLDRNKMFDWIIPQLKRIQLNMARQLISL